MEEHIAAKCISHPLRRQILTILKKGKKSPNEISELIEAPLTNVSYHVRQLSILGAIELVETEPRRGALEHYYRLSVKIPALKAKEIEYS